LDVVSRRRPGEDVNLTDDEPVMSELNSRDPPDQDDRLGWFERSSRDDAPSSPPRIGRYPIVAPLGKGGQARTFRAMHPGLKSTVVLKLAHRPASPAIGDRIVSEGRLLASLPPHPQLVRVYDVDFHEGRVFLVLEDVPGATLERYAQDRSPDVRWSARTVATIARAVHLVHEQGITHQDLNPRNVLIDREGQPRVIDFGMAWARPWWVETTDPEQIGGTPRYLAPEQALGQAERIGQATDVFGLGGILFFLLTNTPLYGGEDLHATLQQARERSFDRSLLDRPGITRRLRAICLKALAEDPSDRFRTAAELAVALERFLAPSRWRYAAILASIFLISFGLGWEFQGSRRGEVVTYAN
jgi:serine/threonine protein kinase